MKCWELLDSKNKWAHHAFARNRDGLAVNALEDNACQWCVLGAICVCYPNQKENAQASNKLYNFLNTKDVGSWNDTSSYENIFSVLKELDI